MNNTRNGGKEALEAKESDMPREAFLESQAWLPHQKAEVFTLKRMFDDREKNASRFLSLQKTEEKLSISLQKKIIELAGLDEAFVGQSSVSPTPSHWMALIKYLYETGLLLYPDVIFEELFNDEPKVYKLRLRAASAKGLTDGNENPAEGYYSFGVSKNLDEALSKLVGEFLERYPLMLYRDQDLVRSSIKGIKKSGVHFLSPFLVAAFSEEQKNKFPARRFDENSIFRWTEGKSLTSGKSALIPAQMIFWNYRFAPDEPHIYCPITNGAGGMFTLDEAILSGLYELIQRDAFFIFWFNRIAPPRINHSSIRSAEIQELLDELGRYGISTEILSITSDLGVPAFLAILIDGSDRGPAVSVGGGCGYDAEAAIKRALTEAIGVRHWLRRSRGPGYSSLPDSFQPFSPLFNPERLLIWGNKKMIGAVDFFLRGPSLSLKEIYGKDRKKETPAAELSSLVKSFSKRGNGYEIFYYEANHSALQTLGYHSVKVSAPALLPLYLNETCAPLGSERIKEACTALGYKPAETINELPHPFP